MQIVQIKIDGLRNLSNIHIQPGAHFNLLCGMNGSGKTSFLESIYLFGCGRSFRSTHLNTLVDYQSQIFTTFAHIKDPQQNAYVIGFEKNRQARLKLKLNGESVLSISEIAQLLPIQILCPDSFQLLTLGPLERRKFLDWGVFHVEHSFLNVWLKYTRALSQRNSLLRQKFNIGSQLQAWDEELSVLGEKLTVYRNHYIEKLLVQLKHSLASLLPLPDLEMSYYQGWDSQYSLKEALKGSLAGDMKVGYTRVGPQRADLILKLHGGSVGQILSRGQQKLLVCALILAQGTVLFEALGKRCIYLVDDLASELDFQTRRRVIEHMGALGSQVFITGIEMSFLKEGIQGFDHKMFHVEHGRILEEVQCFT